MDIMDVDIFYNFFCLRVVHMYIIKMVFFYYQYDPDIDIKIVVSKSKMTVKELKEYKGLKTGTWSHPKNIYHKQTYKVEIFDHIYKKWILLSEDDVINFSDEIHKIKTYLA